MMNLRWYLCIKNKIYNNKYVMTLSSVYIIYIKPYENVEKRNLLHI